KLHEQRHVRHVRRHEIDSSNSAARQLRDDLVAVPDVGRVEGDVVLLEISLQGLVVTLPPHERHGGRGRGRRAPHQGHAGHRPPPTEEPPAGHPTPHPSTPPALARLAAPPPPPLGGGGPARYATSSLHHRMAQKPHPPSP